MDKGTVIESVVFVQVSVCRRKPIVAGLWKCVMLDTVVLTSLPAQRWGKATLKLSELCSTSGTSLLK